MGFDLSFALSRAAALSPAELDTLAHHLRKWRGTIIGYDWRVPTPTALPTDVIAWSTLRPTRGKSGVSDEGGYLADVVARLHDALADVRDLIPGATLAFADDFGALAWTSHGFDYSPHAAAPTIPRDGDAWSSLATARDLPDGRAAADAARASRAARPRTKAAATAALASADRATLIQIVLAPRSRELGDVERTAAVELLGADPDLAASEAIVERVRRDGIQAKWTEVALRALAATPHRCSWATAFLAFDRGWPGAAQLVLATVTEEAIAHLARVPTVPRWSALVVRALDAIDNPAAQGARRVLLDRIWERFPAAQLAVVEAVVTAQRVLVGSPDWTGTGSALPVLDADPRVRAALQQIASALAAFETEGGDPTPWLAHGGKAGAKALAVLEGTRVTQEIVNRGLAALADFAVTGSGPARLYADHRVEIDQLELDWLERSRISRNF